MLQPKKDHQDAIVKITELNKLSPKIQGAVANNNDSSPCL